MERLAQLDAAQRQGRQSLSQQHLLEHLRHPRTYGELINTAARNNDLDPALLQGVAPGMN